MNNWKIIPTIAFATVLIFGAGVFTGGMLVDYVKQVHPRQAARRTGQNPAASNSVTTATAPRGRQPEILTKDFLQRLTVDLQLDKEQHDAVQKIISEGQNSMRKVVQDARLEIREVLTPEQRAQFDEIVRRPFHKPLFGTNAPPGAGPATGPALQTNAP